MLPTCAGSVAAELILGITKSIFSISSNSSPSLISSGSGLTISSYEDGG
jgi:hypothetical protein